MAESPFDDDISELNDASKGPSFELAQTRAVKRQRWEENVVKRILTAGGRGQLARKLAQRHFERTNEFKLTFHDFKMECPEFPMFLGFEKLLFKDLEKAERQLMDMRKAAKNVLVDRFYGHREELPLEYQECNQGVVFEWLHHGSQYKLIHNQYLCSVAYPWTRFTISQPEYRENLYIEDLDSYLYTAGWSSNAPQ